MSSAEHLSADNKSVLMVAFHYPPCRGSSGLQRTLKFSRYLRDSGWQPTVLTIAPHAYKDTGDDLLAEVPEDITVVRAFGLDAARHLSLLGRYPDFAATPDRWASWRYAAVPAGRKIIRDIRPQLIWSTFPIATAHQIALNLARRSGLPWIADFRDPMVEGNEYPADRRLREARRRLEQEVFSTATAISVTTGGTQEFYGAQYPDATIEVIANGFDNENFARAEKIAAAGVRQSESDRIELVHSGIIYPLERDPSQLFNAIAELKNEGRVTPEQLRISLRATGNDEHLAPLIRDLGIGDIVRLEPPLDHLEALSEMLHADGVLLLQAANCNNQIPAKLYEYLRAETPILGLTDPEGDTGKLMRSLGLNAIAPLDDKTAIKKSLNRFLHAVRDGTASVADRNTWTQYSREAQSAELAKLFDRTVS